MEKDNRSLIVNISPISINKCWKGRRFKTYDYCVWREELGYIIRHQETITGWVNIDLEFHIKSFKATDTDNMVKPIMDSLVENEVITDDRFVKKLTAEKFPVDCKSKEKVIIKITKHG